MKIKEIELEKAILNIYDDFFLSKEEMENTKKKIAEIAINNFQIKLFNNV